MWKHFNLTTRLLAGLQFTFEIIVGKGGGYYSKDFYDHTATVCFCGKNVAFVFLSFTAELIDFRAAIKINFNITIGLH